MNPQEAKFILGSARSNGADASDEIFREALEQAQVDPALRNWLAREQAFDAAISAKISEVRAPAGLRESILAGGRVSVDDASQRSWWQQPALIAMAASLAVVAAVTVALWPKQTDVSRAFTEFALTDAGHAGSHGGKGEQLGALQATLGQPSVRLGEHLPVDFSTLRKTGCRTIGFKGHEVLEVCFQRDGVWFHCYIAQRSDFPTLAVVAVPALFERKGFSSATWADAGHLYVVVSGAGRSALEKLL